MQGFLEIIDALGGVTVNVPKAVPTPGNPPGARHPVPDVIPAGSQFMDGTTALVVRAQPQADTDYRRADRQRAVLAALARQVSLSEALAGYSTVTSVLGDRLRTSLTTDEFTNLLGAARRRDGDRRVGGSRAAARESGPPQLRRAGEDRRRGAAGTRHRAAVGLLSTLTVAPRRATVELCAPMSNQTDAPALDRLRRFEHDHRPAPQEDAAYWFAGRPDGDVDRASGAPDDPACAAARCAAVHDRGRRADRARGVGVRRTRRPRGAGARATVPDGGDRRSVARSC